MKPLILMFSLFIIIINEDFNIVNGQITTGIIGIVEYGAGDCMPSPGISHDRTYHRYDGFLYFVDKEDIDRKRHVDFEQMKMFSIRTSINNGELAVELPEGIYVVMPADVYVYNENNTIIINKGKVLEKDFSFWKCLYW